MSQQLNQNMLEMRQLATYNKGMKGYSLLELIAVLAMISALAVIARGEYFKYTIRARVQEAIYQLEQYQQTVAMLRARKDSLSGISTNDVLYTPGGATGSAGSCTLSNCIVLDTSDLKYVKEIRAAKFTSGTDTVLLLGAKVVATGITSGNDFVYIAGIETSTGNLSWKCGASTSAANNIPANYLPKTCQDTIP